MALGDNNNTRQQYETEYYSRSKFVNYDEHLSLGFSFWKGLLKVKLSHINEGAQGTDRFEDRISIYITPAKARVLMECIDNVIKDGSKVHGTDMGSSDTKNVIAFAKKDNAYIIIFSKVTADGNVEKYYEYPIAVDNSYTLEWTDFKSMQFEKNPLGSEFELLEIRNVFKQFVDSSIGSTAYSVMDMGKFDYSRMNMKINKVAEKLGVSFSRNSYNGNSGSSSYFNRSNESSNKSAESTTMDDIDDMLA